MFRLLVLLPFFFSIETLALSQDNNDKDISKYWQNIRIWLASWSLTNSGISLPFAIPISTSYGGASLFSESTSLGKALFGKNASVDLYEPKRNFKSQLISEHDEYLNPYLFNRNNVITIGMIRVGSPPVDDKILELLGKVGLAEDEDVLKVLSFSTCLREIANGLVVLERGGALTSDTARIVIQAGESSEELANMLVELQKKSVLNNKFAVLSLKIAKNPLEKAKELVSQASPTKPRLQDQEEKKVEQSSFNNSLQDSFEALPVGDIHWYDDDEINALLQHYVGNKVNDGLMNAISLTQRAGGTVEDNLGDRERQLRELEQLTQFHTTAIVLPINLGNNHWAVLYIHRPDLALDNPNDTPIITYIDPLGDGMPEELSLILQTRYPGVNIIDLGELGIRFQYDGYNCGPWIVEVIRKLVETDGYLPTGDFDINAARIEHRATLEQNAPHVVQRLEQEQVLQSNVSYITSVQVSKEIEHSIVKSEPIGIIKERIYRLVRVLDDSLQISNIHVHDGKLKELLGKLLTDLNIQAEEMVKSHSKTISTGHYKRQVCGYLEDSEELFKERKLEILKQARNIGGSDCRTTQHIVEDLEQCFTKPFVATLEELRQAALEEELVYVLNQIPRVPKRPTCFISYAWGHAGHVEWVHNFDRQLRDAGIDVHLDIRDNLWGSISRFISNIVTDDHVVIVGTPELRKKWDDDRGAVVGGEIELIHQKYIGDRSRIVKVLLTGTHKDTVNTDGVTIPGSYPSIIGGDISGADFSHSAAYYEELFKVVKKLYEFVPEVNSQIDLISEEFMQKKAEMDDAEAVEDIKRISQSWQEQKKKP